MTLRFIYIRYIKYMTKTIIIVNRQKKKKKINHYKCDFFPPYDQRLKKY